MTVPAAVAYVRDLLLGFGPPWYLCGGWAADAWLGRQTRDHGDVDVAAFHADQRAIYEYLSGWALVAHDPNVADDITDPWNGRRLDLPAHIHVLTPGSPLATSATAHHAEFEFEFLLNERRGADWELDRAGVAIALDRCARRPTWGLPTAPPEVVLFYKSVGGEPRPRDEQDFLALLPILSGAQRSWLRDAVATVQPGHPWLARLG